MSDEYDDEMQHVFDELTRPGNRHDEHDGGPPIVRSLCRECVRDLPDGPDGRCAFCRVVTP